MIIITGATSFIGMNLLEGMEKKGINSVSLVRNKEDLKKFGEIKKSKFVFGDLNLVNSFEKHIKKNSVIIHLANITDSDNPNIYYTNVEGTRKLLRVCKKKKVKNFIYLSSSNVGKNQKDRYDSSKFICELLVKKSSLPYTIIRPSVIYGKYDYKNIFLQIKNLQNKRFKIFLGNKKDIQPVYVGDVIDLILNNLENKKNKIITITTPPMTKKEFIRTIKKVFSLKLIYIFIPNFIANFLINPKEEVFLFSKEELKKELRREPTSFENGLRSLQK
jgi:nucleoside-diphosphate-sugar epimerase